MWKMPTDDSTVYQRGWVINSQRAGVDLDAGHSISKGMGDQFSAERPCEVFSEQYIKGDG